MTNSAGAPVLTGALVSARPAVLWGVRYFPSLLSRLMILRAVGLWVLAMPVTAAVFAAAVVLEAGAVLAAAATAVMFVAGLLVALFSAVGAVTAVGVLLAAGFGLKWLLATRYPGFDADPWMLLGFLAFVLAPVMLSPAGPVVLIVLAGELFAATVAQPVRTWRLAWKTRRKWPMVWATIASTTARPQAAHGGGTSALFGKTKKDSPRELLNHPALGLLPDFSQAGSVAWRVFAPNGQLVEKISELSGTIAAQMPWVLRVAVQSERDGTDESWGLIRFWFADQANVLDGVEEADFSGDPPAARAGARPVDDSAGADVLRPDFRSVASRKGDTAASAETVVLGGLPGEQVDGVVFDPTTGEVA